MGTIMQIDQDYYPEVRGAQRCTELHCGAEAGLGHTVHAFFARLHLKPHAALSPRPAPPQLMWKCVIINAPTTFRVIWSMVK